MVKVGDLVIVSKWVIPNLTENERTGIVTKLDRYILASPDEDVPPGRRITEPLYKVQFSHNKLLNSNSTWVTLKQIHKIISRA